jgi:NAD+ kinase
LTGGAYLQLASTPDASLRARAKTALALFGSTSPSYLILQSLDAANAILDGEFRTSLCQTVTAIKQVKERLTAHGYRLIGDEELKLTVDAKAYGYTGIELAELLREHGIECEFCDPDFLVLMPSPFGGDTALERTELSKLSAVCTGNYTIEERMLLDAEIRDKSGNVLHRQHILNDVILMSGLRSKIAEFSLYSQNGMVVDYRADGVIVATPTGSTAYSFSAGGPVIDPTARIISVTPLCPHTLLRGSVLLAPDTELRICGKTRDDFTDIHVTMDGKNSRFIPCDACIHIVRSPYTLGIVKIGPNRFYDILETKLNKK